MYDIVRGLCEVGDVITIEHIIGVTVEPFVEAIDKKTFKVIEPFYWLGELIDPKSNKFKHLRHAIKYVEGKELAKSDNYSFWPRLRLCCQKAEMKLINVPGGHIPLHYTDEIAVPDFNMSGSHWYIVKRRNVSKLLKLLPLEPEKKVNAD